MLLSASTETINLKLLGAQQLDFIVILQMHTLRTWSNFKKNNGKKKKDDEDLLQLKKIYDEEINLKSLAWPNPVCSWKIYLKNEYCQAEKS